MSTPDDDPLHRPPARHALLERLPTAVGEPLERMLETGAEGARSVGTLARAGVSRMPQALRGRVPLVAAALVAVGILVSVLQPRELRETLAAELGQHRIAKLGAPIRAAAGEFGLDPYLVAALVFTESSGRVDVVSSANALGLMQLKLATAAERARLLGAEEPTREQLLSEPALNLRLGAAYLAYLIERQDGSVEQALMAYNAGPTAFNRWLKEAGGYEAWMERQRAKGEPALGSVRHYAAKVLRVAEAYRDEKILG